MRKITVRTLVLGAVILFLLAWNYAASAQDEDGFSETFDDATLPMWEHSQNVRVENGVLRIDPDNFAFRNGRWGEPDLSLRIRLTTPGGVVIHYHASDQGVYRVVLAGEGSQVEIGLEKEQDGENTLLAGSPLDGFKAGEWNTVQITFDQGLHTVLFNSSQVLQAQDDSPLPSGGIGFAVFGENAVEIDDLVVKATPLAAGEPQPEEAPEGEPVAEPSGPEEQGLPPASVQTTPLVTPQPGSGTRSLLEELFASGAAPLDLQTYAVNLGLASLLAFVLSRVYIHWGASLSNRRKFAANFMLITVTTTFIILVVRSSVALSLGLVGALSIVRFRAAIKEPEELAYLFLAVGLGIGLGDNQRLITILAFAAAIVVLGLMKAFRHAQADVNMHLNIAAGSAANPSQPLTLEAVMDALQPHCAKIKLLRFDENEQGMELSFLVELRDVSDLGRARAALHDLTPGMSITFLDNKGIW